MSQEKSTMLWFTGSSPEGLPFIHDSFRPGPKPLHHKPRPPRPHLSSTVNGVARQGGGQDRGVEGSETFRLPLVEGGVLSEGVLVTPRTTERGEGGRNPVSFTSYMHRYKACARLKGISPRAYCSTRMKPHPSGHSAVHTDPPSPVYLKDTFTTSACPTSSLPAGAKPDLPVTDRSADGTGVEASPADPKLPDTATVVNGNEEFSLLEKQIEATLKRDTTQDDGMTSSHHSGNQSRRRGGSGGVAGRGRGRGGGRPLGDIITPRRLQELLDHKDERTLPYTYYRTSINQGEARLEDADIESLL